MFDRALRLLGQALLFFASGRKSPRGTDCHGRKTLRIGRDRVYIVPKRIQQRWYVTLVGSYTTSTDSA